MLPYGVGADSISARAIWGNAKPHGRTLCAPTMHFFDRLRRRMLRRFSVSKSLPLRGRCPEGAEGENLAIARNISDSRTVLSPTACGRSPLAEGAKG